MPDYKLVYFNVRGRAENARMMFKMAGVKFEDKRIEREDWPKHKDETPNGQVPVLYIDGKAYCQSHAIDQYLAERYGYYGKSSEDRLQINQFIGNMADIYEKWPNNETDEKVKEAKMNDILDVQFPKLLEKLDKELCDKKLFLGDYVSLADVSLLNATAYWDNLRPKMLGKYKNVKAVCDNTLAIPNVKAWVEERPKTLF